MRHLTKHSAQYLVLVNSQLTLTTQTNLLKSKIPYGLAQLFFWTKLFFLQNCDQHCKKKKITTRTELKTAECIKVSIVLKFIFRLRYCLSLSEASHSFLLSLLCNLQKIAHLALTQGTTAFCIKLYNTYYTELVYMCVSPIRM